MFAYYFFFLEFSYIYTTCNHLCPAGEERINQHITHTYINRANVKKKTKTTNHFAFLCIKITRPTFRIS